MKLSEILKDIVYTSPSINLDAEINDVVYDSRKAVADAIFVCIKGFKIDSHEFINDVYEKGARIFVVQREVDAPLDATIIRVDDTRKFLAIASANLFGNPSDKLKTIAITGTKGKTSVSFMLKSIFEAAGHKVGVIGSTGTYIGNQFTDTVNSTPESYLLHKYYKEMLDNGCDIAIIEATSQGFKMARTHGIHFDLGIFSNLSPDHIGENEHKDFDEYLQCKKMIFDQCDCVVVNSDSEHFEKIVENASCDYITVGEQSNADYTFKNQQFSADENGLNTAFTFVSKDSEFDVSINTPGQFSIYNASLAIASALLMNIDENSIKVGLSKTFVKGRMEIVPINKDYTVIIDFAHNEFSVKTLFDTIKLYKPSRIISVFGCGGNRSKLRRYGMGEVIGKNSDLSIITSDNSRFEKVEDIISDILIGMNKTDGEYIIIPERKKAIKEALRVAQKGDVILLIGKGHEMYEEIEGVQYPFDEREVVYNSLKELQQPND